MQEQVIVTLPEDSRSNSAKRRGTKEWIKRLDSVDSSRKDGYAFVGEFVPLGGTVEVPSGTWFLEYAEDTSGSGVVRGRLVRLHQVQGAELVVVERWTLDSGAGWALKVRDAIHSHLAAEASPDLDALRSEREQIVARLREIDEILGASEFV